MQAPPQAVDLKDLKQSLEEELQRLKVLAMKIERAMQAVRVSEVSEKVRRSQMDPEWLRELREQYNDATCKATLQANLLFPIAQE